MHFKCKKVGEHTQINTKKESETEGKWAPDKSSKEWHLSYKPIAQPEQRTEQVIQNQIKDL